MHEEWLEAVMLEFFLFMHSEKELLESLPLGKQCTEEEQVLLHFLFENKLKKVKYILRYIFLFLNVNLILFSFTLI